MFNKKTDKPDEPKTTSTFSKIKFYVISALILVIAVVLIIGVFQISGCLNRSPLELTSETTINISALEQQILSIGELALIEYNYKALIAMQDSHQIGGWNIPLTQKSFIITIDGRMKVGIDTSEINVVASEQTKSITIRIPQAKILSHELFEETMVVFEESSGLFNKVSISDWAEMAVAEKQAMEEQVSTGDTFERAENDAVRMLQAFIISIVPEDYTVTVTRR